MMAGMEIHCPWQTWVAPSTSYLKASLNIVITYLSEITLSHFNINYSCILGHPLHALHCTNSIITSFVGDMFSLSYESKKYHAASVPPSSRGQL